MSSAVKTTKTYTYRSDGAGANTDVSIQYSADLSALSRLEVSPGLVTQLNCIIFILNEKRKKK